MDSFLGLYIRFWQLPLVTLYHLRYLLYAYLRCLRLPTLRSRHSHHIFKYVRTRTSIRMYVRSTHVYVRTDRFILPDFEYVLYRSERKLKVESRLRSSEVQKVL